MVSNNCTLKIKDVLRSDKTSKKYVIDKFLGSGCFGTVVRSRDINNEKLSVAIKVATIDSADSALNELEILMAIKKHQNEHDYENKHLIKMVDFFIDQSYFCIALEVMELSLSHYIYETAGERFLTLAEIKRILYGVLMGLVELKKIGIIHADITPENIMLRGCGDMSSVETKIVDFGLAHFVQHQEDHPLIQSRHYRSPEVIMYYLPYSAAIDVWSAGCILGELLIKREMYPGKCEYDQLRYIIESQGHPPVNMIKDGMRSHLFFTKPSRDSCKPKLKTAQEFLSTVQDDGHKVIKSDMVIYDRAKIHDFETIQKFTDMIYHVESEVCQELINLLKVLLKLDPQQRISAEEAVKHPFFQLRHKAISHL